MTFARKSWNLPPLGCADDAGVPSVWSIQAVVIDLLCAALTPHNFTLADLARAKQTACRFLGEAKRKRQRQRIFQTETLT
jgi:hypothetical protein